ncbi:MAG: hypothetical protein FWF08_08230 [Oscillospiraceae bacterium]|nr:hypothetical protein [Oscillospiraceae bacterium]
MEKKNIQVKIIDNGWGVEFKDLHSNNTDGVIKMQSKEAAVRYARICEQRTGSKALFPQ